jgi:hypothetical protein
MISRLGLASNLRDHEKPGRPLIFAFSAAAWELPCFRSDEFRDEDGAAYVDQSCAPRKLYVSINTFHWTDP